MLMEHLEKVIRKKLRKIGHIVNNSTTNFYPPAIPCFFLFGGTEKIIFGQYQEACKDRRPGKNYFIKDIVSYFRLNHALSQSTFTIL